jgi:hypothetical protein
LGNWLVYHLRVGFQPRRDALAPLASAVAVLALSDEPTLAMVVGTVGVAWLVAPRELAGSWRDRLLMVASPFVATLLTLLVLGGTFSIGAPKQAIELVPARVPGFYMASLPLGGQPALASLACDYLGPFGVMVSGVLSAFGRRSARGWVLLAAHAALFLASLAILLVVRVNHDDMESHRAVTGLMLLAPVFWLSWVARLPAGALRDSVIGVGGLACLVGVVSTAEWVRGVIKVDAPRLHSFWGDDWFYTTDCVAATGAKSGRQPAKRYQLVFGPIETSARSPNFAPVAATQSVV